MNMKFTNINVKNFINYIINFDNVDNILSNCSTQSEKGYIFERLFDVVIKFGFCEKFENSQFNHLVGNSNNAKLKTLINFDKFLKEKVISGNSGGCSDITLQNKYDKTYIFISSKYPKTSEDIKKQKSVNYYGIQNIIAIIDKNKNIYKNYKILLVVPDKKKVLDKVKNANESSNYITKYMTKDNILDKDDLNKYFLLFKQGIIKNLNNDWNEIYLSKKENLIENPKELLELINECLKPKDTEKKQFGEVFTPMNFINDNMLKDIEIYWKKTHNENIWENEKLTWYDPCCGMGNYSIAIYYKLFEGLKNKMPNENERKKHIIEKQLYIGELNKKNCLIIKQIFNIENKYSLNLYEGDTLNINLKEIFKIDKFDIIIGNPPYNEKLSNVGAKPLYNKFIEYYVDKCKILSFITPSRWFAGGKGLDKFRKMMINRTDILYIKHYSNASKIFGNTISIEGGVNYFLINKDYNGLCNYNGSNVKFNNFDIILDSKYYGIVNKFINNNKINNLYLGRYFGIESNDKNLTNNKNLIKCYVSQQKGFIKYIDKKFVKKEYNFFKVITARANGKNGCFGNIFIGKQLEIHTGSYISFKVSNENEAKSLLSYMKCKLPNFMLSLRKISQDISEATCKWIPLPPLNKEWNDKEIYEYFKLSENEIKLIKETKINGYKNLTS